MKDPKEYLKLLFKSPFNLDEGSIEYKVVQVIRQVQNDTWNAAIELAAENAKIQIRQYYNNELLILDDEEVFFGNDYPESCYSGRCSVNSDSILKLKIK